jgi:hypothetical protein
MWYVKNPAASASTDAPGRAQVEVMWQSISEASTETDYLVVQIANEVSNRATP